MKRTARLRSFLPINLPMCIEDERKAKQIDVYVRIDRGNETVQRETRDTDES